AEAERRHKMHTAQMEKFAAAAAEAANAPTDYSSSSASASSSSSSSSSSSDAPAGGSLASDEQLAALREKLTGNA
ncbi:MAG: 30S ribosomal protein S1, partial [Gordonia sp. (in: high G+C Gram-positive bacteria)]